MTMSGPVLVATDLSEAADEALRQGDALARGLGTRLHVCHVLPSNFEVHVLFPQHHNSNVEVLAALATKARAAVHERVTAAIGRPVSDDAIVIDSGSPRAGIRAAIEQVGAGVVVLGPGATAVHMAHHASWTVLVARPAPDGGGVLGATDFSDPALPAVETAIREAARRGTRLQLLHALNFDVSVYSLPGAVIAPAPPANTTQVLVASAEQHLRDSLKRFDATGDCVVTLGPAASSIIEAAAALPAALVVVGTHGRSGLARWVLGSVAERVMRKAPCSVLVVPLGHQADPVVAAAV